MTTQQRAQMEARLNISVEGKSCEECGAEGKLHRHHADYSKPLEVEILCPKCHRGRHAGSKSTPSRRFTELSVEEQEDFKRRAIAGDTVFALCEAFDMHYETARRNRESIREEHRKRLQGESSD